MRFKRILGGLEGSRVAQAALVFVVSFLAYANSIWNGFVYDDVTIILENLWIRDPENIPAFFTTEIWAFSGQTQSNFYRPIPLLISTLVYHLFTLNPMGYHLTYVLLNSVASVLFLFVSHELFKRGGPGGAADALPWLPLLAALLFAVHPIHTEVAAWNGSTEMTLTIFTFLCLLSHIGGRRSLAILFFTLAAFTKETAMIIPVILLASDYAFERKRFFTGGIRAVRLLAVRYLPYVAVATAYMLIRANAIGGFAPVNQHPELTAPLLTLNIFVLFSEYMVKLAAPVNLTPAYYFDAVTSFLGPKALFAYTVAAAYMAALFISARRGPLVFFSLVIIAVPLLPVFYIPAFGEHVFAERYLYMPSAGFIIIVLLALTKLAGLLRPETLRRAPIIAVPALIAVAVLFTATVLRNPVWKDELSLWTDTVEKSPGSSIAQNNMGRAIFLDGRLDEAVPYYVEALRINRYNTSARNNLGYYYFKKRMFNEAAEEFRTIIEINPFFSDAYYNLGLTYGEMGRTVEAYAMIQKAMTITNKFKAELDAKMRKKGAAK